MNANKTLRTLILSTCSLSLLASCSMGDTPLSLPGANTALPTTQLQSFATGSNGEQNVPGQMIVKYRAGRAGSSQAMAAMQQLGVQKVRSIGTAATGIEVIRLQPGQSVATVTQALQQNPAVEYAEPVFTIPFPKVLPATRNEGDAEPSAYPNDAMFNKQYAHQVTSSQAGWVTNKGNPNIVLGIVDSGVDVNHPDLKGKIVGVRNSADGTDEAVDYVGHGTHVAGIASAMTNNGLGVAGVAPNCRILAVKVAPGQSTSPTTAGIADGIMWAADHGANVINLSLGSSRESKAITDAVKYALGKNVVVIAAMGNDGREIRSYPAAVPGVIAVGSTDSGDRRSSFSNMGDWMSVSAPGSNILSTFPLNQNAIGQKEYGSISGTSMATPFVTGLAGLIRSQFPGMPVANVKRALELSADDKGNPNFDKEFGHGRVNVNKALLKAAELNTGR